MKVDRSISKRRYFVAGIITILLFTTGLLVGMVFDYGRVRQLENTYQEYDLNYRSLQLQFSLLNSLDNERGCVAFNSAMNMAVRELDASLQQVENYKDASSSQEASFETLQRKYVLDNIRYWTIVTDAKKICDIDKSVILYFYSKDDCKDCSDQGVILTYFKRKYGENLLVFPINVDLMNQEPLIGVLSDIYNVTSYPSIVVEDKMYEGVVSKDNLFEMICENLDDAECGGEL